MFHCAWDKISGTQSEHEVDVNDVSLFRFEVKNNYVTLSNYVQFKNVWVFRSLSLDKLLKLTV